MNLTSTPSSEVNPKNDWNDLACFEGLDAVAHGIDEAVNFGIGSAVLAGAAPAVAPWPEPMLPGSAGTPAFPEDILQGVWGDMAKAVSASTQTPPALAIMCVLGVLATLVQRRYEVAPHGGEDYTEPLALWVLTASPSGTRKTAIMKSLLKPILVWEKLQYDRFRTLIARNNAARSTAKKRIEALNAQAAKCTEPSELKIIRDTIEAVDLDTPEEIHAPKLFTGDATAEQVQNLLAKHSERMAIYSDEPGILRIIAGAYSGGSPNLDVYLQAHAGSAIRVDRAGRVAHIDKPSVSFNLMVQNGMLSEVAGSRAFRDSGFLARFLFAVPTSNVGKRDVRKHSSIDADVRDRYERGVMSLLEGYLCEPGKVPQVQTLDLADSAQELWLDFAQYLEDNHGDGGKYESIRDWTSKLAGAVARIAAVLELAEVGLGAQSVSFSAMDRAIRLAHVLIPHAQAAFNLLGTDTVEVDALAVLKWIQTNGYTDFTRRDCQKALEGRFRTVAKLMVSMERLEEMDCVREFKQSSKGTKPLICYRVNPALLQ